MVQQRSLLISSGLLAVLFVTMVIALVKLAGVL